MKLDNWKQKKKAEGNVKYFHKLVNIMQPKMFLFSPGKSDKVSFYKMKLKVCVNAKALQEMIFVEFYFSLIF